MNIDRELEEAREDVRSAAVKTATLLTMSVARAAARSASWSAEECSEILVLSATWAADSAADFNDERLKQLEMIKAVL